MDVDRSSARSLFSRTTLLLSLSAVVCGALIIVGCTSAPLTNRRQLLVMSEDKENAMGLTAYEEVLKEEPLSKNEAAAEMVRRVGRRIAAVADRPDFQWDFNLIDSPTQNAFCLPGGKVAIYTGILPVCQNEAGLAVVMSHEIGHAIARHGGERMSHQTVQNTAREAVKYVMRDKSESSQEIVLAAYGVGSEYGAILPFSRKHELEADHIGIMLMSKAGYDPAEAPQFWERFAGQKDGKAPMEFLSTHPSDARRSAALRDLLPEAMKLYQAAPEKVGMGEPIENVMQLGI
ncbi:MAG: M48 family metallopeptidase [Planctomycetaceae bacterium]